MVDFDQGLQTMDPYVRQSKMQEASRSLDVLRPSILMAFACESVTSDPGGRVSFQNVMDGITAADFPVTTGRWCAIFCFFSQVEQTVANCRVVVADKSGEVIAQTRLKDLTFTADIQTSRTVVGFQGLTWPYPGRYFIKFIANRDDVLASFPMLVQHAPLSTGESAQDPSG